ncbi:MAG: DNA polymerase III subunit gamma/tau [Gammaproteobacteria bacterium]|jgi:DNA polymerase-3 subunit gamma/tau|nr:DNA polymerase III subunit gamma/tau [Gammaproteobacteria bacterium]
MSYQVLARKWRPRLFTEMIGQEHVVRALVNALSDERLHHAYLFTGTRGVGKTTVARIFAKALNCERGVSATPCGECASCRELDEGRFVDLIEVDAASRTKVEDTRDLLEYAQYAPTRGRYKVYLIDEVHMLSKHSFNALLKTLEEPPPHVKFLLATTDPQRLPVTILSRCLQFNLRRMPEDLLARHLAWVLEQENIPAESGALARIARAGDGSVRDALSLLDEAIAYGGGRLLESEVCTMLGTIDRGHVYGMLDALAAGNGAALLVAVRQAAEFGVEYDALLAELITVLQRVAVAQVVPEALDAGESDAGRIRALAATLGREDVQLYYQIALIGRRDLPYSPDPRTGVEMILLRMLAFRPDDPAGGASPGQMPARTNAPAARERSAGRQGAAPAQSAAKERAAAAAPSPSTPSARTAPKPVPHTPVEAPTTVIAASGQDEWDAVLGRLDLQGMARELAANCTLLGREGGRVRLMLDRAHAYLRGPATEERVQRALQAHYGEPVTIDISIGEPPVATPAARRSQQDQERRERAIADLEADAEVRALRDTFDARIIPETVQPIE